MTIIKFYSFKMINELKLHSNNNNALFILSRLCKYYILYIILFNKNKKFQTNSLQYLMRKKY